MPCAPRRRGRSFCAAAGRPKTRQGKSPVRRHSVPPAPASPPAGRAPARNRGHGWKKIMAKLLEKIFYAPVYHKTRGKGNRNRGLDKGPLPRYTLARKFVSGRGAIPHWRYSPRPLPKSADPVRLRGQRYSPDARNGRQIRIVYAPCCSLWLQQGAFLVVFPVPIQREKGFPIQFWGRSAPTGGYYL